MTDNDGDADAVAAKYQEYADAGNLRICFSTDNELRTLEPQLLAANGRAAINRMIGMEFADDEALLNHMSSNKTAVALKIFESADVLQLPEYIQNAVAE